MCKRGLRKAWDLLKTQDLNWGWTVVGISVHALYSMHPLFQVYASRIVAFAICGWLESIWTPAWFS